MSSYSDRIFQGKSTFPGLEEWYYRTREGVAGPYFSREDAARALRCFIKYCRDNRLTGGREEECWAEAAFVDCSPFQALAMATLWALSDRLASAVWKPAPALPAGRPEWLSRGSFKKEF